MFDDILGEDKATPDKVRYNFNIIGGMEDKYGGPPSCRNCMHGSHILSNYPGKVLCQKYRRHKPFDYKCRNWDLRK